MADVSVLLTSHDRPGLLRAVIENFVRQRTISAELIVVDDSADPASLTAGQGIVHISVPFGTPLGTKLNIAAERASAPVLAKWDDDDYYGPSYLSTMLHRLHVGAAQVVFAQPFLIYNLERRQLKISDSDRCSGATLTTWRSTWARTPFREIPREVDGYFLLDVIDQRGADVCAGFDVGEQFVQLRHGGHLWTQLPDGTSVDAYLRHCRTINKPLDHLVSASTASAWQQRYAELHGHQS